MLKEDVEIMRKDLENEDDRLWSETRWLLSLLVLESPRARWCPRSRRLSGVLQVEDVLGPHLTYLFTCIFFYVIFLQCFVFDV